MADIVHGLCEQCHTEVADSSGICNTCRALGLVDTYSTPTVPVEFPFPTWVFPPPLQQYIESFAKAGPFPLSMVGASVLPVAATAVGDRRNILVSADSGWLQPSIVWLVNVGHSGCGKSPIMDEILKPLLALDTDAHRMFLEERDAWQSMGEKERKEKLGSVPYKRAWIRTDATIEALSVDLSRKRDILCYYDEFSQWIGQIQGYVQKQGEANRAKWLQLFGGLRLDRRRLGSSEEIDLVIPDPRVSIVGGIQPGLLHKLGGRDDDGMVYRFLFARGEKIPRSRRSGKITGADWWASCVRHMATLTTSVVPLCERGFALIDEFDERLTAEGVSDEVAAKMKTYAARLALVVGHLWMFYEGTKLREITEDDMERSLALCRFFVAEREPLEDKFIEANDGRITYSTVENVWAYIKRQAVKKGARLNQREVQRGKPAGILRADTLCQVLCVLRDDGRIKWYKEGREHVIEVVGDV